MTALLPSISVVVPNYNGAATIESALLSLIDQQYPKLEILVVDGGSTDGSVEIIRKYEPHITWWTSEKDSGHCEAINKGFARATGEIVNWLCSDDVLLPGALEKIGRAFAENPTVDVVAAACRLCYPDPSRNRVDRPSAEAVEILPCRLDIPQQACYYRKSLLKRSPVLDETMHYACDIELWCYFVLCGAKWRFLPDILAEYRFSKTNLTATGGVKITRELEMVYRRYVKERVPLTFWHRLLRYPLERVRRRHRGILFELIYYPYECTIILLLAPFYGFRRVRWMCWTEFG